MLSSAPVKFRCQRNGIEELLSGMLVAGGSPTAYGKAVDEDLWLNGEAFSTAGLASTEEGAVETVSIGLRDEEIITECAPKVALLPMTPRSFCIFCRRSAEGLTKANMGVTILLQDKRCVKSCILRRRSFLSYSRISFSFSVYTADMKTRTHE